MHSSYRRPSASLLLVLALGACQSVPGDAAGEGGVFGWPAVELLAAIASNSIEQDDTIELEARLGALTQRLDELIARLSPQGTAAFVDAAISGKATANDASVDVLCKALDVADRRQRLCIENIANVNTVGYRRQELATPAALHGDEDAAARDRAFVRASTSAGMIRSTERSLDLAIDGEGFFEVVRSDGSRAYTRAGSLQLDARGVFVTADGAALAPEIVVPPEALEVAFGCDGTVRCRTATTSSEPLVLGAIELVRFANADGLESVDGVVLLATAASGQPLRGRPGQGGRGVLRQRYVELANVSLQREVLELQSLRRQRTELRRALAGSGMFVR